MQINDSQHVNSPQRLCVIEHTLGRNFVRRPAGATAPLVIALALPVLREAEIGQATAIRRLAAAGQGRTP
jgi:hypothetical protein